jgi:hypothetical protein
MKLDRFFATVGPFLEGRASRAEAAQQLFGETTSADAVRLGIYGRFCRLHRREAVDSTYSFTREKIFELKGEAAWDELVERFIRAHPMKHFELNENGVQLPGYLPDWLAEQKLPSWLAALADFEWWEWRTKIALDDPSDQKPDAGPLRLASTVEVRPYPRDFVPWIVRKRRGEPAEKNVLVLFWRDLDLDGRRENASHEELLVLKAVSESVALSKTGLRPSDLAETLADLKAAGILLGRLPRA